MILLTKFPRYMEGPGTITWEEFVENAESFVRVSDEISDYWELHGDKETPGQAYLTRQIKTFESPDRLRNLSSKSFNEAQLCYSEIKDPFEATSNIDSPLITEHHVLWSLSYGVPVLYFNAWMSDYRGMNPVDVESVQKIVHDGSLGYNELSQAIHPILGTTFLHLHPCMSKELLQNTVKSKNKLVSWLSTVAPVALDLKLKMEYFELTQ